MKGTGRPNEIGSWAERERPSRLPAVNWAIFGTRQAGQTQARGNGSARAVNARVRATNSARRVPGAPASAVARQMALVGEPPDVILDRVAARADDRDRFGDRHPSTLSSQFQDSDR